MARGRGKMAGGGRGASLAASPEGAAEAREKALEEGVNRWAILFYAHRALQAFRAGHSQDFRQLRDVIYAVLARPLVLEKRIGIQLRIIQLLSRIEEDWAIDTKTKLTPLEYALVLLDKMKNELDIGIDIIEEIRNKIKEAAVITCLKNKEYEQASKILRKHMSKDPSSQKMRSMFQSIIREKNFAHPAIWNFSYKAFQQRILLYLESCLSDSEPFLLEMAKRDLDDQTETRLNPLEMASKEEMVKETSEVAAADKPESVGRSNETLEEPRPEAGPRNTVEEQPNSLEGGRETVARPLMEAKGAVLELAKVVDECQAASKPEEETSGAAEPAVVAVATVSAVSSDSDRCSPKRMGSYGFSTLRDAFKILSNSPDADEEFSKLDKLDWTFPKPCLASDFHAAKCQTEKNRAASRPHPSERSVSISTLVMGSESWNPPTSCRVPSKRPVATLVVRPAQPQIPTQPDNTTRYPRLAKRRLICLNQDEEKEVWSDEDELFESKEEGSSSINTSLFGSKKKIWTSEESQWIKEGVKKFGEGRWKAISQAFPFKNRTPVAIKDRWRTMKNLGLL
ncbi:telomeric repeat-binding factor 2 [Podarcis lilfordi]|uniref:Telomeric repeat-binding factor 2 n=2 Tax=Podarcis lilfordi TaxID=74358 RepID=A0AA35KRA3_9SAUR|nr:telomeric repeat-binding factor 2 [Podarcis lilfordi]